jgi:hypothetical protein
MQYMGCIGLFRWIIVVRSHTHKNNRFPFSFPFLLFSFFLSFHVFPFPSLFLFFLQNVKFCFQIVNSTIAALIWKTTCWRYWMAYFLNFFSLSWDNNKWHDNHAEDLTLNRKHKDLTMLHEYKIIMYPFPLKHG